MKFRIADSFTASLAALSTMHLAKGLEFRAVAVVAYDRARDHLLVTGVAPASEFLDDLRGNDER